MAKAFSLESKDTARPPLDLQKSSASCPENIIREKKINFISVLISYNGLQDSLITAIYNTYVEKSRDINLNSFAKFHFV